MRDIHGEKNKGYFVDCPGSYKISCMTDALALWAEVAEEENKALIADRLASRGMKCSVYGATFLLHALFDNKLPADALKLMADRTGFRSWSAMLMQGATITKESWEDYKDGLDWNHSWGTAPLHVIPRGLFGLRPTSPGFATFTVKPQLAFLEYAKIQHPTVRGVISVDIRRTNGEEAEMILEVPAGTVAEVTFGDTVMEVKEGIHMIKGRLPLE